MTELTVGLDIGTSSVKAIAADGDGNVVASARVPHEYRVPAPERLEHDATVAWRDGPLAALAALDVGDHDVRGVSVSAMVPSLTAVDENGTPLLPGLLYGDERGRAGAEAGAPGDGAGVRWVRPMDDRRGARRPWPLARAGGGELRARGRGRGRHDHRVHRVSPSTTSPSGTPSSPPGSAHASTSSRACCPSAPRRVASPKGGAALASGCIDAFAEELVAGADQPGDVLVLLGTTLIVWVVAAGTGDVPGWVVLPNPAAGQTRVGGPSNAGGLFCDWVGRMVGPRPSGRRAAAPGSRAGLGAVPARRAVADQQPRPPRRARRARPHARRRRGTARRVRSVGVRGAARDRRDARDALGSEPRRIVASGGGIRVDDWLQALADATGLPVDCVAVPDGAALGSAWLARMAAGLEEPTALHDARRWARAGRTVDPRADWLEPVAERYERFRRLTDALTATTEAPGPLRDR